MASHALQFARSTPQTLLFDADDTLWENNVYFERAISAFISYLDHRVHTAEEVREHLNTVERATIAQHGYGLKSFRRSLVTCFEQLTASPVTDEKHRRIVSFAESIAEQEIELLPSVAECLPKLAARHTLHLITKGDAAEQTDKLDRSGLRPYFAEVEVLDEKTADAYRALAAAAPVPGAVNLDDRQQPTLGHQPRACRRLECRLHPPRLHLGARARERRCPSLRPNPARSKLLRRAPRSLLIRWQMLYSTSD